MNKKEEYSYSNSSGTWESFGKPWGEATGKSWGDATKEQNSDTKCPFVVSLKPCKTCPCDCKQRTEPMDIY